MPIPTVPNLVADAMMAALGVEFTIPAVDLEGPEFQLPVELGNPLYEAITSLNILELTTGAVGGAGTFDKVMSSLKAHLDEQFTKNRITGEQYTKAYIELTTAGLSTGLQFLLQKDTARWGSIMVQQQARKAEIEAVTARITLEIAKAQLAAARSQAEILEAQYVLAQLQIANEVGKYDVTYAQLDLIREQFETARAGTMDTRSDGVTAVTGMLGKQKALYAQQIVSYEQDAKYKVAKIFSDSWIAQKTIDEGLTAPTVFTNATIETVIEELRTGVGLV